jgi:hypothetical protein
MSHAQCDIVRYQNDFWVVLAVKASGYLRIIRPHVGNEKREIMPSKAQPTGHNVVQVNYKGKDVLVTRRGMLISMVSERLLKNTTPDGMAMLREAEAKGNALCLL